MCTDAAGAASVTVTDGSFAGWATVPSGSSAWAVFATASPGSAVTFAYSVNVAEPPAPMSAVHESDPSSPTVASGSLSAYSSPSGSASVILTLSAAPSPMLRTVMT